MSIKTTAGGENAVFIDNIDQLQAGKSEDECVAYSAANIFYSAKPGTTNRYAPADVTQLADKWYTHFTGSIDSSAGLSEGQLQAMFTAMGLHWETIPVTNNGPANDEAVRNALRAGKLVAICAAESSFFDLEIGRPPYSWNTQPYNHCIVASGLITSGPWKNNVWVRDTVAVSGGYPPSTKRPYDLGKMNYVSLTAVSPTWLKGEMTMPVPTGWADNGSALTAPDKKTTVVKGFRDFILKASSWESGNVPLEEELPVSQVLLHNLTLGTGTRQCFRDGLLWYTSAKGVVDEPYVGLELKSAYDQILALQAQIALLKASQPAPTGASVDVAQVEADINAIIDATPPLFAKLLADIKKL